MLSDSGVLESSCHFRMIMALRVVVKPGSCSKRHRDVRNKSQETPGLTVLIVAVFEDFGDPNAVFCKKSKSQRMCKSSVARIG